MALNLICSPWRWHRCYETRRNDVNVVLCFVSAFSWYNVRKYWFIKHGVNNFKILYFKLSTCSECCILSFGWFSGVSILCSDVSEHTVLSIFIGGVSEHCQFHLLRWCKFTPPTKMKPRVFRNFGRLHHLWRWNWQSVPKRQHIRFRRRRITEKKEYNFKIVNALVTSCHTLFNYLTTRVLAS
jgi:hypothetical protein